MTSLLSTSSLLLTSSAPAIVAFAPHAPRSHRRPNLLPPSSPLPPLFATPKKSSSSSFPPSTVSDPSGPTPPQPTSHFPSISLDSLPESHYDPHAHPIPHQPWRRGDTDGCHDPLTSPWRLEAESIIRDAVSVVGASVYDVTWYMAKCVVSIAEPEKLGETVAAYTDGRQVLIEYPDETDVSGHVFRDPDAGTEDELFAEEDEYLDYEQYDEETEYEILKANLPVEYDEETGEALPPRDIRSRAERMAELEEERRMRAEEREEEEGWKERPDDGMFAHPVDGRALATISKAILNALGEEDVEDRLRILSRHDIILTSPLDSPVVLDSQKEFNNAEGKDVYVETRDPWGSNRVLFGKLVDRNAMDVVINQDNSGRMVTIPNNMVHQVLCVSGLAEGSERVKMILRGETGEDEGSEEGDEDDEYGEDEDDEGGMEVEELDVEEEEYEEELEEDDYE
ncbi:hypothetical protein ACHAXS_010533 [Conticribra weissflogii]